MATWPSPLSWSPALAGSTAGPAGTNKSYLRSASAPCLVLAPSVPSVYLREVPALLVSGAVPHCGRSGAAVPGPLILCRRCRCRCRRLRLAPWSIGWWGGVLGPLPAPVCPPPALPCLCCPLRRFLHPGAMHPLRGVQVVTAAGWARAHPLPPPGLALGVCASISGVPPLFPPLGGRMC